MAAWQAVREQSAGFLMIVGESVVRQLPHKVTPPDKPQQPVHMILRDRREAVTAISEKIHPQALGKASLFDGACIEIDPRILILRKTDGRKLLRN
jgi:hypothetical protein